MIVDDATPNADHGPMKIGAHVQNSVESAPPRTGEQYSADAIANGVVRPSNHVSPFDDSSPAHNADNAADVTATIKAPD